jgi:hypothetical protein
LSAARTLPHHTHIQHRRSPEMMYDMVDRRWSDVRLTPDAPFTVCITSAVHLYHHDPSLRCPIFHTSFGVRHRPTPLSRIKSRSACPPFKRQPGSTRGQVSSAVRPRDPLPSQAPVNRHMLRRPILARAVYTQCLHTAPIRHRYIATGTAVPVQSRADHRVAVRPPACTPVQMSRMLLGYGKTSIRACSAMRWDLATL